MVRPVKFEYNDDTSLNDAFQKTGSIYIAQKEELNEFDNFVRMLRDADVIVMEIEDEPKPFTPQSIFPACWFSIHTKEERAIKAKESKCDMLKTSPFINDLPDAEKYIVVYPLKCPDKRVGEQPVVVRAADAEKYKTYEDIKGQTIGAQTGTIQQNIAETQLPEWEL